jgi:hypothetical protein
MKGIRMMILGKKTVAAGALGVAFAFTTATAPLAEGRDDAVLGKAQVSEAMISTQSATDSAVGSMSPAVILGILTLIMIAAAASGDGGTVLSIVD